MSRLGLTVFLMAVMSTVSADPISFGALSSNDDGSTEIISDSLNNREWLRWDVLDHLTYAETLVAVTTGAYQGWSIAGIEQAHQFVNALLFGRTNNCNTSAPGFQYCYRGLPGNLTELFGDSASSQYDRVFFLSDNLTAEEVGGFEYGPTSIHSNSRVILSNEFGSKDNADSYPTVGWLLYRDTVSVPTPGTLPLLGIGLLVLTLARRRRQT